MIVTLGYPDGLSVSLDDELEDYNPIRTREMCAFAVSTFTSALADSDGPAEIEADLPE